MKKLLYTNLGWIALIMTPCISVFGQKNTPCAEEFMFRHFEMCGNLIYKVCTETMGCTESKNRVVLDFSSDKDIFSGTVEVKITGFKINERRCEGCERGTLDKFAANQGVILVSVKENSSQIGPVQFKEILKNDLNYKRKEEEFSAPIVLKFEAIGNGRGELKVKYYISQIPQHDKFSFTIPYEVTGLDNRDEYDWNKYNARGVDGWCDYVFQYSGAIEKYARQAKENIAKAERDAWRNVDGSTSANDFKQFWERFERCKNLCVNCAEAKKRYRELKNPPKTDEPAKRDKAAFDLALGHGKVELYQAYLKEYPNGISAQEAKDSIIRLTPIGRVSLPDEGGWIRIQFTNIVDPRVDIPEEGSLIIDTTRLDEFKSKGILSFKYGNKSGIIPLEVYDSAYFWKSLKIDDLNNMLEAKIIEWDSSEYELKMLVAKGVPPYRIEITDENGELVYSRTGIRETEFVIVRDSLLAKAKITGDYTVTVGDSDTNEQAIIAGTFRMEVKRKFTLVIIGAGVLLAAIIVIFLLIRRRGQKQRDMYDIR